MAFATMAVIVITAAVAWVLTDRLVAETTEVAESTGEVLIATQQISASFAEADAAAVSVHLAGAEGNKEQRRLYEQATERATTSLERVARLIGDDENSHDALGDIGAGTTRYSGLIEAARLASVEGLPAADSILQEATALNRAEISPAVDLVASRARSRFDDLTSSTWYLITIALLVVALAVLLIAQYSLHRRFRRVVNVPLAAASLILLALIFLSARGFGTQQSAFNDAEDDAFDAITVSEQLQQLVYRHRATGTASVLQGRATDTLGELEQQIAAPDSGLIARTLSEASSVRESAAAEEISVRWQRYVAESGRIQDALASGATDTAQSITQGSANAAFNGFNTSVEAALLDNREQFLGQLDRASDSLRWLRAMILVGSLLAAVLTWWGFSLRIGEYR